MTQFEIPYATSVLSLKIPEHVTVDVLKPQEVLNTSTFNLQATCNKIFTEEKWNYLENKSVLIVVNDATRATPTEILLDYMVPFFKNLSIGFDFIIATGTHRSPTTVELQSIFGKHYNEVKDRIFIHESKDESNVVSIGTTSFGSEIKLNKTLFDEKYARVLTINSIEPHYFAGWTGGRKSVVPGLAAYDSITKTHIHALSNESKNCRLEGNPVHDDLQEGFNFFLEIIDNKFFTFQFVLDSQGTIHELFAGEYEVFAKGVAFASNIFQVPITQDYELVIAVAFPPLDQDLYQSHKALENTKQAIKKTNTDHKSTFILISGCKNGIGPDQFLVPFKTYAGLSYMESMKQITDNYKLGFHKAGKILEAQEYADLYVYSKLEPKKAAEAHFTSITGDLNEFISEKINSATITKVALVLDACVTVPTLN